MNDELLVVRGLSKAYNGQVALAGIDLHVRRGEALGLVGPNGSGKTTTIEILSGFRAADAGIASIDGVDLLAQPAHARARLGIGRVFQESRTEPQLTVREHLLLGMYGSLGPVARVRRSAVVAKRDAVASRISELLELLDLIAVADAPAGVLDNFDLRRLELGRALALRPRLLLLDEPTAGLAPNERTEIGEVLSELVRNDVSVILIEHDFSLVSTVCSRVVVLDAGTVVAEGDPISVAANQRVHEVYFGETNAIR